MSTLKEDLENQVKVIEARLETLDEEYIDLKNKANKELEERKAEYVSLIQSLPEELHNVEMTFVARLHDFMTKHFK